MLNKILKHGSLVAGALAVGMLIESRTGWFYRAQQALKLIPPTA